VAPNPLTEQNLNYLLSQIRNIPTFEGDPSTLGTFVRRANYFFRLYPTTNDRQTSVIFGASELQITGDTQKILQVLQVNNWPVLRAVPIDVYKTQTPAEELLRRLYNSNFQGNLRTFCNEIDLFNPTPKSN